MNLVQNSNRKYSVSQGNNPPSKGWKTVQKEEAQKKLGAQPYSRLVKEKGSDIKKIESVASQQNRAPVSPAAVAEITQSRYQPTVDFSLLGTADAPISAPAFLPHNEIDPAGSIMAQFKRPSPAPAFLSQDPEVAQDNNGYRRARRYFGPTRPTGHDIGNAMHGLLGLHQMGQAMFGPGEMADDMNAHFNRAADRSLMNAPNITNRMAIASRERQNNRLMDVIANVLGGGGAAANPLPQDAIDSAQRSLAFSSAPRNNPVPVSPEAQREINQILSGNIAMRAPDVERTLNPANAALGRAIEQQRLASLQPFARMMV